MVTKKSVKEKSVLYVFIFRFVKVATSSFDENFSVSLMTESNLGTAVHKGSVPHDACRIHVVINDNKVILHKRE